MTDHHSKSPEPSKVAPKHQTEDEQEAERLKKKDEQGQKKAGEQHRRIAKESGNTD